MGACGCVQHICNKKCRDSHLSRHRFIFNCDSEWILTFEQRITFTYNSAQQYYSTDSFLQVSFIWGHFVFHEPVNNELAAYAAVVVIMTGLFGMSYFSSTESLSNGSASSHSEEEHVQDLLRFQNDETADLGPLEITQPVSSSRRHKILIHGRSYSRRNLGRLSALMCGVWGGSILVPMHYSTGNTSGLGYVISFSTGALGEQGREIVII